ncbi:MAG: hypothetical protein ACK5OB_16965 [Pirellula sp.]
MTSNPFSSKHFQPGAIPYRFPTAEAEQSLLHHVCQESLPRMAIVGPHGSGKSTLVAHLLASPPLRQRYPALSHLRLSSSTPWIARMRAAWSSLERQNLVVIDGFEQFTSAQQRILRAVATFRRARLMVTSHADVAGFETLWKTAVDPVTEQYVIEHLLGDRSPSLARSILESPEWLASRKTHGMNLRESLFDMYDWYRDTVDAKNRQR